MGFGIGAAVSICLLGQCLVHSRIHPLIDRLIRSLLHSFVDSFAIRCWFVVVSLTHRLVNPANHSPNDSLVGPLVDARNDSLMGALIDSANR